MNNDSLYIKLPLNAEYYFADLTNEQAGQLIKDLLKFNRTGHVRNYGKSNKVGHYFKSIIFDLQDTADYSANR